MKGKDRLHDRADKTVEINLFAAISVAVIILAAILSLFAVFEFIKGITVATKFEVSGSDRFSASEMAAFAEIGKGDMLYERTARELEETVENNCAYIKSVRVRRNIFGKLKFIVSMREAVWVLEISGDYYILDGDLLVLEETANIDRVEGEGAIWLTLPNLKRVVVGERVIYGDGDEEISNTEDIMKTLRGSLLGEHITRADIDNRYDIHLGIADSFEANIGSFSRLKIKLEYLITALGEAYDDGAIGGTVDISDAGDKVSVRPIYATPEEDTEEAAG